MSGKGSKRRPELLEGSYGANYDRIFRRPQVDEQGIDWSLPVLWASDCDPCDCCGEPFCEICGEHYADCAHPGPHSEGPESD